MKVDEEQFTALVQQHRTELRVHCYRMLGSLDEAEDLVQETFLRAWKNRDSYAGRASIRAWLYRIATNACLDYLDGRARRVLPHQLRDPSTENLPAREDIPWLQPFPDQLATTAEDTVIDKETIELAFLAAIQHLPPRQRAVLILRDVLDWPAKDTAALLEQSVASVNSALQRARATMREQLPQRRLDWTPTAEPSERAILRRYMAAMERADLGALAELLTDDVRTTMPPWPMWLRGRDNVLAALAASCDPGSPHYAGQFRMLPTRANGHPAVATYVRGRNETEYHAFAISVLRIEGGRIAELTAFHELHLFDAFALPRTVHR